MKICFILSKRTLPLAFFLSLSSSQIATLAKEDGTNTTDLKEKKSRKVFSTEMSWTIVALIYSLIEYRGYLIRKKAKLEPSKSSFRLFLKSLFSGGDDKSLTSPSVQYLTLPEEGWVSRIGYRFGLVWLPYLLSFSYWLLKKVVTSKYFFQWLEDHDHPYVKGYIQAVFLKKGADEQEDRIERYCIYASIVFISYHVGAALFYSSMFVWFHKIHLNKKFDVNPIRVNAAGLLGIFVVPILFYIPEIILNATLGSFINLFRKPKNKEKES
ncbi:MAG: hypothetical protein AAF335_00430 [Bacteroidota bacterium]